MKWLIFLERKFGKFHIKHLMKYIIILNAITLIAITFDPSGRLFSLLLFIPQLVLKGEIWRIFTFILIPPDPTNILFSAIAYYFYFMIGEALERVWGSFKFNLYYFIGIIITLIGGFATGSFVTPMLLNLSLFLAFAREFPDEIFLIFFVLPVKAKYLAYVDWFYIAVMFVMGGIAGKVTALAAIANYLIFYYKDIFNEFKRGKRRSAQKKNLLHQVIPADFTYHRCHVCGRTEKSNPSLVFRYCNQCDGDFEFCNDHIFDHSHEGIELKN